jgi:hypothetical protein
MSLYVCNIKIIIKINFIMYVYNVYILVIVIDYA